jgi:hypothetical protein
MLNCVCLRLKWADLGLLGSTSRWPTCEKKVFIELYARAPALFRDARLAENAPARLFPLKFMAQMKLIFGFRTPHLLCRRSTGPAA